MLNDHPRGRAANLLIKKMRKNTKQNGPRPAGMARLDNVAAEWIKLL
jgi:hypothetical protein